VQNHRVASLNDPIGQSFFNHFAFTEEENNLCVVVLSERDFPEGFAHETRTGRNHYLKIAAAGPEICFFFLFDEFEVMGSPE
jgi:hypothetical protein